MHRQGKQGKGLQLVCGHGKLHRERVRGVHAEQIQILGGKMKTELTIKIEKALGWYAPTTLSGVKINAIRGRNTAYEVPVTNGTHKDGLVDCVRIYEYFKNTKSEFICGLQWNKKYLGNSALINCSRGITDVSLLPDECDTICRFRQVRQVLSPNILVVCYEIKISKADFKSKNGHNFFGNQNYYVIPKELYDSVKDLVPDGIGVVLYSENSAYPLKIKKPCETKEMTDEEQKWVLLTMLKKHHSTSGFQEQLEME
jgi:hypothetical protein